MKVSHVRYGMTRAARDGSSRFEHDRIDVEIALEEGDTFERAKERAKALCLIGLGHVTEGEVKRARELVALIDQVKG